MRPLARPLLNGLIAVGLIIAAWPLGQMAYGLWSQRSLAAQWQNEKQAGQGTPHAGKVGVARTNGQAANSPVLVGTATRRPKAPWPLTKFSIPDLGLVTYVVQGIDEASLRRGPGHYPSSALPGAGNCIIAGHRNIYGSFFAEISSLRDDAKIILESRKGTFTYEVQQVFTVTDTDRSILGQPPAGSPPILTLITCTDPHSSDRIIVQAQLKQDE